MSKEAMKLALEALENWVEYFPQNVDDIDKKAITSMREELSKPDFWEGYVPEPDKRQQALDKKAENARELGLDYEPAQQEPVAWICYGAPGKRDIDFDEADINELPIGTLLYTSPPAQRTWQGLTDEEIEQGCKESWVTEQAWQSAVWWAEAKLRSKNNG